MKTVHLIGNIVHEVIPEYGLPVEKWYGPAIAAQCIEAQDEVDLHWVYDPKTQMFSPSPEPIEQEPVPDPLAELQEAVKILTGGADNELDW